MKLIDRIPEIPVEIVNQVFEIPDELAVPENRRYEKYRGGIYQAEAGVVLFAGGLASAAAGVEAGGATAILGGILTYAGGMRAMLHGTRLREHSM